MTGLAGLLLANALAAGLIALGAWAASRRLSRQTLVHALWVVALVKLVTPPIVPLPMLPRWTVPSLGLSEGPAVVVIETGAGQQPLAARESVRPAPPPLGTAVVPLRSAPAPEVESTGKGAAFHGDLPGAVVATPAERRWPHPMTLAWVALIAGALVVAALAGRRVLCFQRLLRHAVPAPPALRDRVSELAARVGLRRAPELRLLPARVPPMLWPSRSGPLLLMPEGLLPGLTSEEQDTLLIHELAHVRRRDHWVRWLELAVTVIFWWYPVTWWVRRALRRAEERCCDEWVLRLMPTSAPAYAEGLLKSLDHVAGEPDPLPVGASGAGPVHDLETRLKEILMMTRPTPHVGAPARVALSLVAVLGLAVFPTRAQSPAPGEPSPSAAPPDAPSPAVAPVAAPTPIVAPEPAPVIKGVLAPAPVVTATPEESPENEAALREVQKQQHRMLEVQRRELHQVELRLARERMAREAAAQQEQLRAEAERLRAAGENERAERIERHARMAVQRMAVQRRELELEQARLAEHAQREAALRSTLEKLHALEREGRETEADQVRHEVTRLKQKQIQAELAHQQRQMEVRREVLEVEHQAHVIEMELAVERGERTRADMEAQIETEKRRRAWEHALQERELAARKAEQALRAVEIEVVERDAAGEHAEAEALRAEAEEKRHEIDSLHRGIQEEHLIRATSDLELQMESQLEALRHIQSEGAADEAEVKKEIGRLEAGLEAMRAASK